MYSRKVVSSIQIAVERMNEHFSELDELTKMNCKNIDILKQLAGLRRQREKKLIQANDLVNRAEGFMQNNPPHKTLPTAYLDTEELKDKLDLVNSAEANVQYNDLLIREWNEDIVSLSKEMNQVQGLFHDISQIIGDQGATVDDIESNVVSSVDQTRYPVQQLVKAKKEQKSRGVKCRTLLCLLSMVVVIVVGIMVLMEVRRRRNR
ncbi:hypothetical protein WA538_004409 [Blastocystis sp. DL]